MCLCSWETIRNSVYGKCQGFPSPAPATLPPIAESPKKRNAAWGMALSEAMKASWARRKAAAAAKA